MNPDLFSGAALISLFTLALLEIILGIDNVIFVSIIMGRMPKDQRKRARTLWMVFGIITRTLLLIALGWLLKQKGKALFGFSLFGINKAFDLASLVMIAGGLFLIFKTVTEIHHKLEGEEEGPKGGKAGSFANAIFQIVLVDMVFSFDSVITASGIGHNLAVMIIAVVLAMIVMFFFSERIATFIHKHPTLTMLALSFLVMVGLVLVIDGWRESTVRPVGEPHEELNLKNYVYFAMAFSFAVELLNMRLRKKATPVELREPRAGDIDAEENE